MVCFCWFYNYFVYRKLFIWYELAMILRSVYWNRIFICAQSEIISRLIKIIMMWNWCKLSSFNYGRCRLYGKKLVDFQIQTNFFLFFHATTWIKSKYMCWYHHVNLFCFFLWRNEKKPNAYFGKFLKKNFICRYVNVL